MAKTEHHRRLTDQEYEEQFAHLRFKPGHFSHEAHLRLVFIHLKAYGLAATKENMRRQIKAFANHWHVPEKYNDTVTVAASHIMWEHMQQKPAADFAELVAEFPVLLGDFRSLVNRHYSWPVFGDAAAKASFVEPDLEPLPFAKY